MVTNKLTKRIEIEVQRLVKEYDYSESVLSEFALFILQKETTKTQNKAKETTKTKAKSKELSLPKLKQEIYKHFQVKDTLALKKSGAFQMATSGMGKLDLSKKIGWEELYRKLIGILPGEEDEEEYGCINGINIFKYNLPWKAFGLNPQTSTTEDIKSTYRQLSKVYHPDIPGTGDARIFDRLTVFYKSLTERF